MLNLKKPTDRADVKVALEGNTLYNQETMSILISDEILQLAHMTDAELRLEIAVMLFQQERFTLGQASRFAAINQLQFQRLLADRHIPLHYDVAELREDMESLKQSGWQ